MTEPRERLETLRLALTAEGLEARIAVADPPLLHVVNLGPPALQETIGCVSNDGALWFWWAALEVLLGRADDIPGAVARVTYVLASEAEDE